MRLLRCCLAFLVLLSTFASADLKIKTRTTVMGHSTESTVYIKGSRERTEMSYGGHGGAVSILQCDQKRMVTITGDRCMVMSMGGSESSCPSMPSMKDMMRGAGEDAAPPRKGGVVTITRTANDTGERQEMFGKQLLEHVPLIAYICHGLEQDKSGDLPEDLFLRLLRFTLSEAEAERALRVAIEWGRYGDLFEYNFNTGVIQLPKDDAPAGE